MEPPRQVPGTRLTSLRRWSAGSLLAISLAWAYWPTVVAMAHRWGHDPQYSHGYLVPGFAAVLLWLRREQFPAAPRESSVWGLLPLLAGLGLLLAGAALYVNCLEAVSLLPSLVGFCVLVGGW